MIGDEWRRDFPMLSRANAPVYLDSAATTLKPNAVIDAMTWYLRDNTAAVHRAMHAQSIEVTEQYENTRSRVAHWFGADDDEIVFTGGATTAIHLVRRGFANLKRVAATVMEHHSNLVPWMGLEHCDVIPVDCEGVVDMNAMVKSLERGVDLVAVTHMSNVLGSITPIKSLIDTAHRYDTKVLVDAAQSASHHRIDVKEWDVDFLACSSHKMLGPSGIGALYVRRDLQPSLSPVVLGGQMVDQVTASSWTPQSSPHCYEAGSPPVEAVLGWGAAIDYLDSCGRDAISTRLKLLTMSLKERLSSIPGAKIIGPSDNNRGPLITFTIDGLESHAIAKILSHRSDTAVRSGFHCAQPLHQHLHLSPTVRASLQIYNNERDLDRLTETLHNISKLRLI